MKREVIYSFYIRVKDKSEVLMVMSSGQGAIDSSPHLRSGTGYLPEVRDWTVFFGASGAGCASDKRS